MYPDQQPTGQPQTPPPQFDSNYLDQISTPVQQKTLNPMLLWAMIGGVVLAVVVLALVLLSSGAPSQTERVANLLARTQSLKTLTQDSVKTVKDSKLRAANGSLTTILSGMENEFTTYLTSSGEKTQKRPSNDPIAAEFATVSGKLEEARLNERFDTVYAREIAYQIKKIRSEFSTIYDGIKSESFKEILEKEDKNLEDLSTDFAAFNTK
jgi:hypothetical protein